MMRYQKTVSPVRASIIYALEPVWAAVFSISLGFSQATSWLFIGGSALILGNLIAEMRPNVGRKKARSQNPQNNPQTGM
jgi:drug/metabolite transporter (DMT)-like permease